MPRSNQKKSEIKPPTKHATIEMSRQNSSEKLLVIRAAASASKHGIRLKHGTPNQSDGNCAIESSVFNVNDRDCFREKMNFPIDHY